MRNQTYARGNVPARWRRLNPALVAVDQRYFKLGLIGHPVAHSISPLLHGAALSYANLAGEYNLIDVAPNDVDSAVRKLVAQDYFGWNVTVPHKKAMYEIADELTDAARKVKAVNTVGISSGGNLIGHNTDLEGFVRALTAFLPALPVSSNDATIIGAGGAARAAMWGLLELGFRRITIVARDVFQSQVLREEILESEFAVHESVEIIALKPQAAAELAPPAVLINCTPVGLSNHQVIPDWLEMIFQRCSSGANECWFYDMVYSKDSEMTLLTKRFAVSNHLHAEDGLQMLIQQALSAFEFWTGVRVPEHVMRSAIQR